MIEETKGTQKIAALGEWRTSDLYSDAERAALDYAEHMTRTDVVVEDSHHEALRAHFDEAQIVELTAGIAMENFRSKFNNALGVAAQGFCVLPQGD